MHRAALVCEPQVQYKGRRDFTGWNPGECDRIPDATTCEVDLNNDRSVTASFE